MNRTIGVVAALPGEARAIAGVRLRRKGKGFPYCRGALKDETDLLVVQSGMGTENAFSAARWLLEKGAAALGCFGVSGGLEPKLKTGDVVFADTVLDQQDDDVSLLWKKNSGHLDETFECTAVEGITVRWGPIITVQAPVLDAEGKRALFHRTNALSVDMETAGVARAANQSGLPFFAFRTICDPAHLSLPKALYQCVDQKGYPRIFYLLGQLLRKPLLISHLLRMKRDFAGALAAAPHVRRCLAEMHNSPAPEN